MRKLIVGVLLFGVLSTWMTAYAVETGDVEYVNGTVKGVPDGTMGSLDTSGKEVLEFRSAAGQFSVPYEEIKRVRCREENRFRLGVLPAIAVGLLKARSKRHFVTIEWEHPGGPSDVVTLDASKEKARGLLAVLRARAPQGCPDRPGQGCRFDN